MGNTVSVLRFVGLWGAPFLFVSVFTRTMAESAAHDIYKVIRNKAFYGALRAFRT